MAPIVSNFLVKVNLNCCLLHSTRVPSCLVVKDSTYPHSTHTSQVSLMLLDEAPVTLQTALDVSLTSIGF